MDTSANHDASLPDLRWFCVQRRQRLHGSGCSSDHHPSSRESQHRVLPATHVLRSTSLQFMNTTECLRFDSADFRFSGDEVEVMNYPRRRDNVYAPSITIKCRHLDWQVSSVAQIFNSPSQSSTLDVSFSSTRSFSNVKALRVELGLSRNSLVVYNRTMEGSFWSS